MSVPVFGPDRTPVLMLVLRFPPGRGEADVVPAIARLLEVAAATTTRLGGARPGR